MIGKLLIISLIGITTVSCNRCEGLGMTEPVFLPVVGDCSAYITCWKGVENPQTCAAGLFFHPEEKICVADESVCNIFYCKPEEIESFPIKGECDKYTFCLFGEKYQLKCGDGLYFSETVKDCVPKEQSGCVKNRCNEFEPNALGIFEDEFICTTYYICMKGEPHKQECVKNTYFNREEKKCFAGKCPYTKSTIQFIYY